ncbi:MAG: tetratricopeptide repeat protein [Vampirovibrionales bacterium]|nr:tetratricopeptide repeat protein [Vampirovibrionales bacterium]
MASRVYGYYLPPVFTGSGDKRKSAAASDEGAGAGLASASAPSATLATVHEQTRGNGISITAILDDFRNTMNALGADEPLREEVDAYLRAVSLQASKSNPSVPFIKQSLKTAADSVDAYIAKTLEQPSRVVRDWVDALLLQTIDYRKTAAAPSASGVTGDSFTVSRAQGLGSAANGTPAAAKPTVVRTSALSADDKNRFRDAFDAGKTLAAQGQPESALTSFEQALAIAQDHGQASLAGRTLYAMGKTAQLSADPAVRDQAIGYYQRAQDKFIETQQIEKQARALAAIGAIHDDRNELAQAASYYAGALAPSRESGNGKLTGRILNDAGMVSVRQGRLVEAIAQFKDAANANTSSQQGDPHLLPDIYSNLGEAYRLQNETTQAAGAFRQSLKYAQELRDKDGYLNALTQLAALYESQGQSEKAAPFRQRLQKLQPGLV